MATELAAQASPPIRDLPVPVGFKLDKGRSRSFRGGAERYVDHLYNGGADKFVVARFYKGQMPIQRWATVADLFVQGEVMMDFKKESDNCRIIVSDDNKVNPTHVKIVMWSSKRIAPASVAARSQPAVTTRAAAGGVREAAATELVASEVPPIRDLPVPVGFKLDHGRSRNFRAGLVRYVDHLYKGGVDKFAVARFYMRQMPVQRWTPVTDLSVRGEVMMDFKKKSESCRIIVSGGHAFKPTHIKILLWTSGRIPPASPPGAALVAPREKF